MRYKINGIEIRSENAAKPHTQKSSKVDNYLGSIEHQPSILDFGCGKLRYSDTLVKVGSKVTFVDSTIQLEREQVIRGEHTTVKQYVEDNYPDCKCVSFEKLPEHQNSYDVIISTNVLSAIPSESIMTQVLEQTYRLLNPNGLAIFITQHRSSYFKRFESGTKHMFGYLYSSSRANSYYGILGKKELRDLLEKNNFNIEEIWCVGESTFAKATTEI